MGIEHSKHRLKLLYLYRILQEETDEAHPLSMAQLIARLESYGIQAGRKALYEDLEALRAFGADVITRRDRTVVYYLGSRSFELPELKLLADAVSSSRFLTEKKSGELLRKIESLASRYEGKDIQRQVYVTNRVKSMNERIYLNIDVIHQAIRAQKQITFRYFDYNPQKQKIYREGVRRVSPYACVWDHECYYLVSHYVKYPEQLTNFRVDRMDQIMLLEQEATPLPPNFRLSDYLHASFSMFSGEAETVRLRLHESLMNAVVDRFGYEVPVLGWEGAWFEISVQVKPEPPFFAWLFQFGDKAELLEPTSLRERYRSLLKTALNRMELS